MSKEFDKYHKQLNHINKKSDDGDDISDFLSKSSDVDISPSTRKENIWNKIDDATPEKEQSIIRPFLAIAASVSILIVAGYLLLTNSQKTPLVVAFNTEQGEIEQINLPDGSNVTLNAASIFEFTQSDQRNVTLEGEAFFEVKKGEKFTVNTSYGSVEVLGTSFNVYARNNIFEVVCKTGKVKVTNNNSKPIIITPGEAVWQGVKKDILAGDVDNWKKGEFYFENRPLDFVLSELSRQYDVDVQISQEIERRYTGYFLNGDLNEALSSICLPLDLQFTIQNNTVIISEK